MSLDCVVNGRPTGPQVRALHERFGVVKRGEKFLHVDIEKTIGVSRKVHRYHSVVGAWRREVFSNTGIWLSAVAGTGYEAPTDSGQLVNAAKGHRISIRKFVRETRRAEVVDTKRLTDPEQKARDYMLTSGRLITESARPACRAAQSLLAPPKTEVHPQR